jgi:hypothetical protein
MFGAATLSKWQKRLQVKLADKQAERLALRRAARESKGLWKDRKVRVFESPGTLVMGTARPTSAGKDKPLNTVNFLKGVQLVFSDGSFRAPGRRRLKKVDGTVLSGRQLRILRKTSRRNVKLAAQQDELAQGMQNHSS